MASGAFNGPFQIPTSAIKNILANNPKMVNAYNDFNSLSHLNQLNKANALADNNAAVVKGINATNNAAQAAEGQVPSLTRKAGRIVGNGINAAKGALGRVVMTPSLAALGGAAAEVIPVAGIVGSLGGAYASARGEQMDNDPVVQQEKAIRANAIKNGWTPDDEDNWTNAQGQTATYNDIYGMYGPEGTALGLPFENGTSMDIGLPFENGTSTDIGPAPAVKQVVASPKVKVVKVPKSKKASSSKNIATNSQNLEKNIAKEDVPFKLNNGTNWMDTLNSLLPYLALGAGAYYLGRRN